MSGAAAVADLAASPPRDRRLRQALRFAGMIQHGTLTVVMPDGSSHRVTASEAPVGTIVLKHPGAIGRLMRAGAVGLAEAYVAGLWDSPDIRGVLAVAAANEQEWAEVLRGRGWARGLARLRRAMRRDDGGRSLLDRYELGNAFYASWLDQTMSFSAAWFRGADDSLEAAQLRKTHRMCQMLRLAPGMRLLDIGCGWGALAEVAARDYGASVVGITLSPAQLDYAQRRIAQAGLAHRVELRLQDYRDVVGSFDRIATIETFANIAEADWPGYFATMRDRLRKNGVAGLQVITIADRLFDDYRRGGDFVRQHVFPRGMLPSKRRLRQEIVRAGMAWGDEYWFGRDYAETLARWQKQFQAAWPRIVSDTVLNRRPADERFKRMWDYYLAERETAFRAGWTEVGQILIARNG